MANQHNTILSNYLAGFWINSIGPGNLKPKRNNVVVIQHDAVVTQGSGKLTIHDIVKGVMTVKPNGSQ